MKKLIYLFVFTIAIQLSSFGQDSNSENNYQSIRGKVIDSDSKLPISGAHVIVLVKQEKEKGAVTDEYGEFIIEKLNVGRIDLQFSFIGYKTTYRRNILIQSAKQLYLEIELTEKITQFDEVEVRAFYDKQRTQNDLSSVSARSFSIEETEKYAGSLGDPSRMAQNFAGVISAGDQRNDIIIRGNSPSGLLWKLDGIPIPNPNHFGAMGSTGGPVSMLNNNLLTNSDFFTGAFPAEYGNALSGVFDLKMRNGNNLKRQHVFQIGFNGFELGTEGPFKKGGRSSYLINYRYSTLAVMDLLGLETVGGAVPQYQDLSFKFNFPTKKAGIFSLNAIAGKSYIVFEQDNDNDGTYNNQQGFNTRNGSEMAFASLNHKYFFNNNKSRLESFLSFSTNRVRTKVDSLEFNNDKTKILNEILYFKEDNSEIQFQTGTKFKSKISKSNYIDIGISFQSKKAFYNDSVIYDILNINNETVYKYANPTNIKGDFLNLLQSYAQWKHKMTDNFDFYAGIYSQYLMFNESFSVEPRFNTEYRINEKHSLAVAYGLHSQMQPGITYFTQSIIDSTNNIYTKSNMDLDFTKSHQTAASYNYSISKNLRLKVEAYYQYLYDIPGRSVYSNANFGASFNFPRIDSLSNIGKGKNYGLELTLEKFLSDNYYFLITASLFDSKFKNPETKWKNTAFNNQYVINALAGVEIPINSKTFLNINLRTIFAGGKPLMEIDLEKSKEYNTTIFDFANSYENRAPEYFRVDVRFSIKVNAKKISQEWALDIQNITNHQNVFNQEFYMTDNGEAATKFNYQQGFFPMFLYRLNF